jgi:hypothetical protein
MMARAKGQSGDNGRSRMNQPTSRIEDLVTKDLPLSIKHLEGLLPRNPDLAGSIDLMRELLTELKAELAQRRQTSANDVRGRLDLKNENLNLRDAIIKNLKKADPATSKKVDEIGKEQPHDADEKGVNDNLKRRKQALIDAGVWSDAS